MRPKLILLALAALLALALSTSRGRGGEPFAALEAHKQDADVARPVERHAGSRRSDLAAVVAGLVLGAFAAAAVVTAHRGDSEPPGVTETPIAYELEEVSK